MIRTEILQEMRKVRFEKASGVWTERRLTQAPSRRAPVDEVAALAEQYEGHSWNVKHFYSWYRRDEG
jgi:hypothetical protein